MTTDEYRPPKPPPYLKARGRRLWKAVLASFELREDELVVLEEACRLLDELGILTAELLAAPTVVEGSAGQERPHPLFAEVRAHRLALGRILSQLGLADAVDADGSARSSAGRRMARARWAGR